MPPAKSPGSRPTRERLVTAAAQQFRHGGYHATGIKAILGAADAPYGSLYHHFPGGKQELGAAALRTSGAAYRELVELYFPAGADADPADATRRFFTDAGQVLASTDWIDGCPIATVALETASESEELRTAALEVFESWLAVLAERLAAVGIDAPSARALAIQLFCLLEGAFVLARAARGTEALAAAGDAAVGLVTAALASATRADPGAAGRKITSSI